VPNDKEGSYWTLAEVARWISTTDQMPGDRDLSGNFEAIKEDVIRRCQNGNIRAIGRRCFWSDPSLKCSFNVSDKMRWASAVSAGGRPSDTVEAITPVEWFGLDWGPKNHGELTDSLRSSSSGRRQWAAVRFARLDVMRAYTRQRAGRRPTKSEATKNAMRSAIEQKRISREELATMQGKALAHKFGVCRTTATAARKALLDELEPVANSISDK
jgi:hypothetical protein